MIQNMLHTEKDRFAVQNRLEWATDIYIHHNRARTSVIESKNVLFEMFCSCPFLLHTSIAYGSKYMSFFLAILLESNWIAFVCWRTYESYFLADIFIWKFHSSLFRNTYKMRELAKKSDKNRNEERDRTEHRMCGKVYGRQKSSKRNCYTSMTKAMLKQMICVSVSNVISSENGPKDGWLHMMPSNLHQCRHCIRVDRKT